MNAEALLQSQQEQTPAVPAEFVFAYRYEVSECRIVFSMPKGYISHFTVHDPDAGSIAHLEIAVRHGRPDAIDMPDAIAEQLLVELYAHTGPRQLPPSAPDRTRLRAELTRWVRKTAPTRCDYRGGHAAENAG